MPIVRPKIVKPVRLILPPLHPLQRQFVDDKHRFVVAACGSKFGKTFGLAIWIIREAWNTEQGLFWWCAPVYKQAQIAFKLIGHMLPPGRFRQRRSQGEMVYELLYADGRVRSTIDFRSAERPESLRGDGVHGAVIDEAGYWKRDSFISVMTTLTRTQGKLRIISTPKGKTWFFEEWSKGWYPDKRAANPEYFSYQLPTSANPTVTKAAIETLRRNFTDRQFRQEILAEFLDDGAGVFSNLRRCQQTKLQYEPKLGKRYVMGVDWAKDQDYTVFLVMDADTRRVVHIERHQGIDWNVNIDKALRCAKRWNRAAMILDSTGVGSPPFDAIAAVYPFVEAFNIYNNEPKVALIQRLQMALEREEIKIPVTSGYEPQEDPEGKYEELGRLLEGELQMYNVTVTKTGKRAYSAPEGYTDDMVIALALATWKASEEPMIYTFDQVRGV
jgi:phage terminase large subunit-like protein